MLQAPGKRVIVVGNSREGMWYAKTSHSSQVHTRPRTLMVGTLGDLDVMRMVAPRNLDMFQANEWSQWIPMDGSDEHLMELAWRAATAEYVGNAGTVFHTWRVHHAPSFQTQADTLLPPFPSWTPESGVEPQSTLWFMEHVVHLLPIVRKLKAIQSSRELIEG